MSGGLNEFFRGGLFGIFTLYFLAGGGGGGFVWNVCLTFPSGGRLCLKCLPYIP